MNVYRNPVHRGFFPDPAVVRVGEDYYKVNSTFQYFPAIVISHSRDLVHWEIIGHAITENEYLDLSETLDSRGIWAPDISYYNGKFYIMATLRFNGNDKEEGPLRCQLLMTAERAEGPYSKPVVLPIDNIDPSHFVDDDGKHYMIIAPGITVVPLSDDCTKVTGEPVQVWEGTGERCPEGPHILKKDGWYYAIVAEGGTGYGHGINVGRSKNLFGPYESSPYNPVMRQTDSEAEIQRAGHGCLVETQNGDWWCMYLCGRRNGGNYTTLGRETALDPVYWTDDGWFVINDGKPSVENVMSLPKVTYEESKCDDFNESRLSLMWEWVRNPDKNNYSLTERKGFMRLYTGGSPLYDVSAKNTLVRREQELEFTAETRLEFAPEYEGEQAGMVCYYATNTYIRFGIVYNKEWHLELAVNRNKGYEEIIKTEEINCSDIILKVEVKGLTRKFYYKLDNKFIHFATVENCIFLCDEGVPGDRKRHTGTLTGIYACGGKGRSAADFDYFNYYD